MDLVLCILAAPFALFLIGIFAVLVARNGGKPFYSQLRIGQGGRTYRMWKLRSMVADADQKLEAYLAQNPAARAEWDKDQKLKSDPRITPLGSFLRRASIDELPQLWNVFKGDMSLVGPRPMMVEQQLLYPGQDYYDLRPGITGSWQVSDRNQSSFAERAIYDTDYNRKVSLGEDLRILTATVRVVVKATGY
ncbi:MAG: sugar transferase [Paracoccaceae bacterium]